MENNINNPEIFKNSKNTALSVLIVDDCKLSIETLTYHLTDRGHDVFYAMRGEETVEKALVLKPDIILLDLNMPGLGGLQTLKALKDNANTENIPIIIVSAREQDLDITRAIDMGASDYLTKPVDPQVLAESMRKAFTNKDK